MTAAVRTNTFRPLPQPPPPTFFAMDREAAWYEHEERMRPSYIVQPSAVAAQYGGGGSKMAYGGAVTANAPPLSPSSRWAMPKAEQAYGGPGQYAFPIGSRRPSDAHLATFDSSQHETLQRAFPSPKVPGEAEAHLLPQAQLRPRQPQFHSTPSRFHNPGGAATGGDANRAFSIEYEDARRTGGAKGSAFMHKGFFDILSLVNNPSGRPAPSGFRATFSKATGRFRKDSNAGAGVGARGALNEAGGGRGGGGGGQQRENDPFFSSPAPPLQSIDLNSRSQAAVAAASMQAQFNSKRATMPAAPNAPLLSSSAGMAVGPPAGPRAAKKRISIDMVGAPRIDSFVHAAHASDAEQAEEILRRWGRDNVGKIADPEWIERCKEAMRAQQARNQAEAIAQIQAALHQESAFKENPRQLHIVNGTPSSMTNSTNAAATIGHSTLSADSALTQRPLPQTANSFERIAEEGAQATQAPAQTSPRTPRRTLPVSSSPYLASPPPMRPNMLPRTNTQGTILVVSPGSTPAAAAHAESGPDYLQYQPTPHAAATADKRGSKAIDGLPGMGGGAGIDALFADAQRPMSMVVRDALPTIAPRTLAGDELAGPLAAHAGAALRPSLTTVEKSVAAKIYFENLFYGILKKPHARETRRAGLEAELAVLRIPESSKQAIRSAWVANETDYLRDLRARVNVNSFSRLKTIGHGAFGVVALVQERGTGQLFAMKQLRKADMLRKGQEGHVRAERDLMTSASASQNAKWIVKLVYSFQDVDHLYLIMEFMGGGDLLNLLIEKDIFAEDFARFYVAEMILAINEAHRLGYIHRDIKPDNFLFTSQGHVKLADFGLCQSFHWAHDGAYYDQQRKNLLKKHGIDLEDSGRATAGAGARAAAAAAAASGKGGNGTALNAKELNDVMADRNEDGTPLTHVLTWRERNMKKIAYSVVGTNNYMAPEVLRGYGYDQSCDWWSLGVIVFEMLYGYPPFVSKSRHLTRQKILNWRQTLRFPPKPRISRDAQDFISKLLCERDDRLGSQSLASVSRPNSLLQGSRQRSGFAASNVTSEGRGGLVDGVDDLMSHPWFRGIDWNTIHTSKAPFVPALRHPADTKHFEDDIDDEPLPAPGAAEAAKNGQPAPVDQPRDPMLRDKAHGQHLLEMRKQLAFVGYTFKSPKAFDPKTQLTESKIGAAERAENARAPSQSTLTGSRLRSMSM